MGWGSLTYATEEYVYGASFAIAQVCVHMGEGQDGEEDEEEDGRWQ